jgi:uncharacterized integral membrane protein
MAGSRKAPSARRTWQADAVSDQKPPRQVHPRLIGALVLVVIILIFIFENTRKTKIRFLVPEVTAPLWVALIAASAVGAAAGVLVARRRRD